MVNGVALHFLRNIYPKKRSKQHKLPMRFSLFLNYDLESNIALNCLLPALAQHSFNIYLTEKVGVESPIPPLQHLAYLEREFIKTSLFPELDRNQSKGFLSFDQISEKYRAAMNFLKDVTTQETLLKLKAFQADLFISIRFGKIFKGEVLTIPPLGIINLHSAILPDYKGVLGTFRALAHGEETIGTTLHYINDSKIDAGQIIHIQQTKVKPHKSVLWHIVHLYPEAIENLKIIIDRLTKSIEIESAPQREGGQYFSFPTAKDFDQLNNQGIALYNLDEYAALIAYYYKVEAAWVLKEIKQSGKLPAY